MTSKCVEKCICHKHECGSKGSLLMVIRPQAEPDFVGSALVRESLGSKDGDDDKIYFFFSERALELECETELTVARVARVCKVPTASFELAFPKQH